jgi:hypothetical protein
LVHGAGTPIAELMATPSTTDPLGDVRPLIARALELANDLEVLDAHDSKSTRSIVIEYDAGASIYVHKLRFIPYPERAKILASDAVNNLRSSLDHLVSCCARLASGIDKTGSFPFGPTADAVERELKKARGLPPEVAKYVRGLCPFPAGNPDLYAVAQLSKTNKHRRITPVVERNFAVKVVRGSLPPQMLHVGDGVTEIELFRSADRETNYRIETACGVRLHEGPFTGATPANAIRFMAAAVTDVVDSVERILRELHLLP